MLDGIVEVGETRYAKSGDLHIAYEVMGNGSSDLDLVHVPGLLATLEAAAQPGQLASFHEHLGRFARVIRLDKRGTGLSDRLPPGEVPTIEERIDDVRAVMDAVGSERSALLGVADGGPVAMMFAASYPERVRALVLSATGARASWAPDYPWGRTDEESRPGLAVMERDWGTGVLAASLGGTSDEDRRATARLERLSGTPSAMLAVTRAMLATDVRQVLPTISAPTLVVHHAAHPIWPIEGARYLAEHIPGARLVELPGRPPNIVGEDPERAEFSGLIEEFLTGQRHEAEVDRVLKTILFTDIVGSTEHAARVGDHRWKELLDQHDRSTRDALERFQGREIKTTGDGFFAAFDGPARAIRCAQAIADHGHRNGLEIRAGLHTGECEPRGDDLSGIAVHIGARVASLAGPGEVLVTSTVRDLVAGSRIEFADRGHQTLKGVPGKFHVLAVSS
jgi:class 3 adenylate cyclase